MECMVYNFGNSVIKQWLQKCGGGGVTMYINMVVFDIFETTWLQVGFTWNGLHTLVRPS